jgi:thiosulfate/3-mercaptopyruvate sulfurtransferase
MDIGHDLAGEGIVLMDARSPERFRGTAEPIDPVAGHVPGAVNRPHTENLSADGRFAGVDALREDYGGLLDGRSPHDAVLMCGSGVTACHNLLAMHRAGLADARLYPGSWSEWIRDPDRPTEPPRD